MTKLQEIKMIIKLWWLNLFSKHKLVVRFKREHKESNIVDESYDFDIYTLEDYYE